MQMLFEQRAHLEEIICICVMLLTCVHAAIVVGLEQNYTVFENVSTFEVCFRVMNPPDDQEFGLSLDLVPVTNAIGKSTYTICKLMEPLF